MFRQKLFSFALGALSACAVLGVITTLLVFFGIRLWNGPEREFPKLPSGRYLGTITWDDLKDGEHGKDYFLFFVDGLRFDLLSASPIKLTYSGRFIPKDALSDSYYPLQVQAEDLSLIFHSDGNQDTESFGKVRGTVVEMNSDNSGQWQIQLLTEASAPLSEDINHRISLISEEHLVEEQQESLTRSIQEKKDEILSLEEKISDRDRLHSEAKERFTNIEQELETLASQINTASKNLKKMVRQLELAQKVTKYGEIVRLARQAQHYDNLYFLQSEGYAPRIPDEYDSYDTP
ncbi:MAG: hypothetical protein KDD60_06405 [Bdellovibrionales bacterium]|nr:hypothetical protein [Bdellovibrionales bacterium]